MAQLVYQLKEGPAKCIDNTPRQTATVRGAAGRPYYIRNRSNADVHVGIFGYIDILVILYNLRTAEAWQISAETSCMYVRAVRLTYQEPVTLSLLLYLRGSCHAAKHILK
jgi:hypothetical protein